MPRCARREISCFSGEFLGARPIVARIDDVLMRALKSVPRKLWENHGVHSERGKESIAHIVRLFAGHDVNHLRQIEELAKTKRAK